MITRKLTLVAAAIAAVVIPSVASADDRSESRGGYSQGWDRRDDDRRDDRGHWDNDRHDGDDRRGGYGRGHHGWGLSAQVDSRIREIGSRIEFGRSRGFLSWRESSRLTGQLNGISSLKRMYERSGRGLDPMEMRTLNARLDGLQAQMRYESFDRNRR